MNRDIELIVYSLKHQMSEMFSKSDRPNIGQVNADQWILTLKQDQHLVKQYSYEQKEWIIRTAGKYIPYMGYDFFQTKSYKRSPETIKRAMEKVNIYGQGWFYFGLTDLLCWQSMINIINKFLMKKSIEKIWLEKMTDKLLAPCPICKIPISYTSCAIKLVDFDYRITCKSCSDHDP